MSIGTRPFLLYFSLIASTLSVGICVLLYFTQPRIAYVNNAAVIAGYQGLTDRKTEYDRKMKNWQDNLDTLSGHFNNEVREFNREADKLSAGDKKSREAILSRKEDELYAYKEALEKKALEEEATLSSGIINQINSFIQEYGRENGYDFILGSTDNGNILFAKKGDDLTDEVIEYINQRYRGL